MMKITIFTLVVLALACAYPQEQAQPAAEQAQPSEEQAQPAEVQAQPSEVQAQPAEAQAPAQYKSAPQSQAHAQAPPRQPQPGQEQTVQILKQDSNVEINGYNFDFETSDGTARQEQGEYRNDTEQQGLLVRGSYKYVAPDGQHIAVSFIADKNGYQPTEHRGDNDAAPAPAQSS